MANTYGSRAVQVEEAPEVLQGGRIEKWRVSMVHTHKKGEPRHSGAWDKVPAHQSYG